MTPTNPPVLLTAEMAELTLRIGNGYINAQLGSAFWKATEAIRDRRTRCIPTPDVELIARAKQLETYCRTPPRDEDTADCLRDLLRALGEEV